MFSRNSKITTALLLLCCTVTFSLSIAAGNKEVPPTRLPFEFNEQLVYEGEFSRLMLRNIDVVEMRFSSNRAPATSSDVPPNLLFTGEVKSKGWFAKLFGLRFRYRVESTVDPKSFAVLRTDKTDEQGERVRTSDAVFDQVEKKVIWTERDPRRPEREPRVVTSDLAGTVHDIISAFYYLRTQELQPGQTYELALSDSGAVYRVPARVVERKRIKTSLGDVPAVRVDVDVFGNLVNEKGEFSVWFTDDTRHLPVHARVSSSIGTLDISLKKAEN